MKIKLFGGKGYEEFTPEDKFEIHVVNAYVYWLIGINKNGRHKIDFFRGAGVCKTKIKEYYDGLNITDEKVRVTSEYDAPRYINLVPKYSNYY